MEKTAEENEALAQWDKQERIERETNEAEESEDKATPLIGQKDTRGRPKLNTPSIDIGIMEQRRKRDTERTTKRKMDVRGAVTEAKKAKKTQADTSERNLGTIMPQRTAIKQYSLRVSIPTNNDPDAIIRNCLIHIFRKLQEIDPKLVIYPWDLRKS